MTEPTRALPVLYSLRRCPYAMRARMAMWIAGEQVVADGRPTSVDLDALAAEAADASKAILHRSGVRPSPRWPQT